MFNEGKFRETLFPSLGNINYYVAHIQGKHVDLEENNRTCGPG